MNVLANLQNWFAEQCDDEWEHSFGVAIETLDNPGWCVRVDLSGTPLENRDFSPVSRGAFDQGDPVGNDWLICTVKADVFEGAGDPTQLEAILRTFLTWAQGEAANQSL